MMMRSFIILLSALVFCSTIVVNLHAKRIISFAVNKIIERRLPATVIANDFAAWYSSDRMHDIIFAMNPGIEDMKKISSTEYEASLSPFRFPGLEINSIIKVATEHEGNCFSTRSSSTGYSQKFAGSRVFRRLVSRLSPAIESCTSCSFDAAANTLQSEVQLKVRFEVPRLFPVPTGRIERQGVKTIVNKVEHDIELMLENIERFYLQETARKTTLVERPPTLLPPAMPKLQDSRDVDQLLDDLDREYASFREYIRKVQQSMPPVPSPIPALSSVTSDEEILAVKSEGEVVENRVAERGVGAEAGSSNDSSESITHDAMNSPHRIGRTTDVALENKLEPLSSGESISMQHEQNDVSVSPTITTVAEDELVDEVDQLSTKASKDVDIISSEDLAGIRSNENAATSASEGKVVNDAKDSTKAIATELPSNVAQSIKISDKDVKIAGTLEDKVKIGSSLRSEQSTELAVESEEHDDTNKTMSVGDEKNLATGIDQPVASKLDLESHIFKTRFDTEEIMETPDDQHSRVDIVDTVNEDGITIEGLDDFSVSFDNRHNKSADAALKTMQSGHSASSTMPKSSSHGSSESIIGDLTQVGHSPRSEAADQSLQVIHRNVGNSSSFSVTNTTQESHINTAANERTTLNRRVNKADGDIDNLAATAAGMAAVIIAASAFHP